MISIVNPTATYEGAASVRKTLKRGFQDGS
jgi:hypothetical protein